jgi:hypothetical protein
VLYSTPNFITLLHIVLFPWSRECLESHACVAALARSPRPFFVYCFVVVIFNCGTRIQF